MTTSPRAYLFNPELRIWQTDLHSGSSYSDGDEVEQRLLATLRACTDVSVLSDELRQHVTDWPSEYHFTPERSNLLRPFGLGPNDCVLELGCGCGAITRYLGETGATVIAVEGSTRRAAIAAERCRDLSNVTVYCDNLQHFHTDMRFSHVTLIGVMEYARMFIEGDQPELQCLQLSTRYLTEGGQLLLAIENQFGLKYFNGCGEDHLGMPGFGLHDLYGAHTPVTFGRAELAGLLVQAGLPTQEWLYPFPDYKLPTIILHSRALERQDFSVGDLLCDIHARDYSGRQIRNFHEGMTWRGLARNNLLSELSNSFLVVANHGQDEAPFLPHWLATTFNSRRRAAYCTQTVFMARGLQGMDVIKERPYAPKDELQTMVCGQPLIHVPSPRAAYLPGRLHAAEFQRQAARAHNLDELQPWLNQWLNCLRDEQKRAGLGPFELPGHLLDAIPCNLVSDPSGQLQPIDLEWCIDSPIAMHWVLIRGIVKTLAQTPPCKVFEQMSFEQAATHLMARVGVALKSNDFALYVQKELALQQAIQLRSFPVDLIHNVLQSSVYSNSGLGVIEREMAALQDEIQRVKHSFSWRITAPLRVVWNIGIRWSLLFGSRLTQHLK